MPCKCASSGLTIPSADDDDDFYWRDVPDSGGARKFVIYCPYVVMNKSGCPIAIKTKPAWQSSVFSSSSASSIFRVDNKVTLCSPGLFVLLITKNVYIAWTIYALLPQAR